MAYLIDDLLNAKKQIDGKWVIARPIVYRPIQWLLKDLWLVIRGKVDVVKFYKQ